MGGLDRIRMRLAAVKHWPWTMRWAAVDSPAHSWGWWTNKQNAEVGSWRHGHEADAELIAHAPADIAYLLAEVARLTAEHDAARAEVERLRAFAAQASPVLDRLNISGTLTSAHDEHDIDAALHILLKAPRPYIHGVAFESVDEADDATVEACMERLYAERGRITPLRPCKCADAWRTGTVYDVPDSGGGDD